MKKESIEAIMADKPEGQDLALWISGAISELGKVQSKIRQLRATSEKLTRDYRNRNFEIDMEISKVQNDCPHYSRTTNPAAGPYGRPCTECDHCGKDLS